MSEANQRIRIRLDTQILSPINAFLFNFMLVLILILTFITPQLSRLTKLSLNTTPNIHDLSLHHHHHTEYPTTIQRQHHTPN
ncbi:hypothetical protein EYC80_001337 [Monilinia laxa]|uniref:Uncharacterized protein n=1 Tax=Monilinia laxa TaxID=61186 RepID=A0A5N6K915_MONLA|nr:hypothetical protein EYC80_001337 [Monilinia laxa]